MTALIAPQRTVHVSPPPSCPPTLHGHPAHAMHRTLSPPLSYSIKARRSPIGHCPYLERGPQHTGLLVSQRPDRGVKSVRLTLRRLRVTSWSRKTNGASASHKISPPAGHVIPETINGFLASHSPHHARTGRLPWALHVWAHAKVNPTWGLFVFPPRSRYMPFTLTACTQASTMGSRPPSR